MKIYKCIIIDDDSYAVKWLTEYVREVSSLILEATYLNPVEALTDLSARSPVDLILMDIKMPNLSGIELSQQVRNKTKKLIFTTAYREYAYEAYELEADAFLLKPYSLSKFTATVTKLFPNQPPASLVPAVDDFVLVKSSNENLKLVKIRILDIVAVESKQNYVMIHTVTRNVLTHMPLGEVAKTLKCYTGFEQFQRSFIIAKRHIDQVYGNTIKMSTGLQITVGNLYRKGFAEFLAEKVLKAGNK